MIMTQRTQPEADDRTAPVNQFDAERAHLRMALDDIAAEVAAAMKAAGLSIEVLFMDPVGDEALISFATDIDPLHSDWPQAKEIICCIVGHKVGIEGLWCRSMPCASSSTPAEGIGIPHKTKEPTL
jgi:hypothetical protein